MELLIDTNVIIVPSSIKVLKSINSAADAKS